MEQTGRISLFTKPIEVLNLTIGLVFALLVLGAAAKNVFPFVSVTNRDMTLVNFFLFQITHTIFNFALPFLIPEMRAWWRETKIRGIGIIPLTAMIFGGWVCLFTASHLFRHFQPYHRGLDFLWSALFIYQSTRHNLGQTYGLGRFYDSLHLKQVGPFDPWTLRMIGIQRGSLLGIGLLELIKLKSVLGADFDFITSWAVTAQLALGSVYILSAAAETKAGRSNKWLFSTRILVFPFMVTSTLGCVEFFILHGLESLFLAMTLHQNSVRNVALPGPQRVQMRVAFSGLVLLVIVAALFRYKESGYMMVQNFPVLLPVAFVVGCMSEALSMTHYYADRKMFRFSLATSRKWIFPLMVGRR